MQAKSIYTHRNRQVHIPDGYIAVGLIVGVHGLKGELKVEPHTDFPERFGPGTVFYMGTELRELHVQKARPHKTNILITAQGIQSREKAEGVRGQWIFVPEENAQELDEDTYWIHDIIGLSVQTEEQCLLGVVQDIIFTGANEVYIVKTEHGVNLGKDILIPAVAHVIQQVDLNAQTITVNLPPGLLEEQPITGN